MFSGGFTKDHRDLDQYMIDLTGKRNPSITLIPTCSYTGHISYASFSRHYMSFNLRKILYLPLDVPTDLGFLERALSSDIIFLSGGNTFSLLYYLKKRKLISKLRSLINSDTVFAGLSAGAIVMTPTIHTAAFPSFDRDENEVNLKNLNGLNFVPFEFFPHFNNSQKYIDEFKKYTLKTKKMFYALPDESAIIINNDHTYFWGKYSSFFKGHQLN